MKTIKLLLIEDDPDDAQFLRLTLHKASGVRFQSETAMNLKEAQSRLTQGGIDVVLMDLTLPGSSGMDTFKAVQALAHDLPIIILSGLEDETMARNAVHAGAEDYLVKGQVDSLLITRAIVHAIERTESRKALHKAEERYRGIFENSVAGIFQTSPEGTYLDINPALIRIYGYSSREEMMSKISDIARLLYVDPNRRAEFIRLMKEQDVVQDFEA